MWCFHNLRHCTSNASKSLLWNEFLTVLSFFFSWVSGLKHLTLLNVSTSGAGETLARRKKHCSSVDRWANTVLTDVVPTIVINLDLDAVWLLQSIFIMLCEPWSKHFVSNILTLWQIKCCRLRECTYSQVLPEEPKKITTANRTKRAF